MDYIILALFSTFVGYLVGSVITAVRLKLLMEKVLEESGNEPVTKNLKKKQIPYLVTEKHGDMLYLFEKESDNFMCQGYTLEDLNKKLAEYKDIHIAFVEHNTKAIWFVNGEVTEHPYEG